MPRTFVVMLVLATVVGCRVGSPTGSMPSPSQTPPSSVTAVSTSEAASPTMSASPTVPATVPAPSATTPGPEGRSEAFWGALTYSATFVDHFDSLRDMTDSVDLVVVGRMTAAAPGRVVAGPEDAPLSFLTVTFAVDEVIRGSVESREPGSIEVEFFLPSPGVLDTVVANVPSDRQLLFLLNGAAMDRQAGKPVTDQERDRYTYLLPNFQAVLRDIDGVASRPPVPEEDRADFPAELNGERFDDLVTRIRHLVATD